MARKGGNPHKDDPSNTPGERQEPRGSEVAARGYEGHIMRFRRRKRFQQKRLHSDNKLV
jgi:hypothetical protein